MGFSGTYTAAALLSELTTDPEHLGYATWTPVKSAGSNVNVCNLINAVTGAGSGTIQMSTMTSAQIAAILLPLFGSAISLAATGYAYYAIMFNMIMAQQGPIALSGLATFSAKMIADGILTAPQATALGQRVGSRAEVLWGQGIVVAPGDVYIALGENF